MKGIFTLSLLGLMISAAVLADVSQKPASGETGTAKVDEQYLDALNKKDAAPDRDPNLVKERTGYDHLDSKKDKQKMEERIQKPGSEAESRPGPQSRSILE